MIRGLAHLWFVTLQPLDDGTASRVELWLIPVYECRGVTAIEVLPALARDSHRVGAVEVRVPKVQDRSGLA